MRKHVVRRALAVLAILAGVAAACGTRAPGWRAGIEELAKER